MLVLTIDGTKGRQDRCSRRGIELSHWHALKDAAYLRHLAAKPDDQLGYAA
jgi:hypothetical protein